MSDEFPAKTVNAVADLIRDLYDRRPSHYSGDWNDNAEETAIAVLRASKYAELVAALKLARIPFAASITRRSDRDEAERELAQIDAALKAAGEK